MPSLEWNQRKWDQEHGWQEGGDEWSHAWGDADMQWRWVLEPRLRHYLPARRIVEIAPGYGRWTHYLGGYCDHLTGVDISSNCVARCRERFSNRTHMTFFEGDGSSLPMVDGQTADLIFSFDSLVHVEIDVLRGYLQEIARCLAENGVAFIHHSNLGAYRRFFSAVKSVKAWVSPPKDAVLAETPSSEMPKEQGPKKSNKAVEQLRHLFWLDSDRSRGISVTAGVVRREAEVLGLTTISQETITWGTRRTIDCITVLGRKGDGWQPSECRQNPFFNRDAAAAKAIANLYRGK